MVHARALATVLLVVIGSAHAVPAGEIEIVDAPPIETVPGPDWSTSYEMALGDAGERPIFLYFTAGWCGYCRQMEQETYSDPEVLRILADYACVKIDIDADANRAVCRRYQPEGGIPSYVVVDPPGGAGVVLPGGFQSVADFGKAMGDLSALPTTDASGAIGHHLALARFYLARGDVDEFEANLAAIDLLPTDPPPAELEALLADAVESLHRRSAWATAVDVADAYLAHFPSVERADTIRRRRAVARYHTSGALDEVFKARIRERLTVFGEPCPEESALAKARRFLGGGSQDVDRAREAWVARQNAALAELSGYGEAAVDLLLAAVRTAEEATSQSASTALGWIASPRARPILARWVEDTSLPLHVRVHAVNALGLMRDPFVLPLYRGQMLRDPVPHDLQYALAEAIRRTGMRMGAIPEAAVGNALLAAAANADRQLRHECLHALLTVEAPYDLAPLVPLLRDHRAGWTGFRNSQYAAWSLLQVTGKTVQEDGQEAEVTPAVAEHLATWLEANLSKLTWDESAKRYR